MDTFFLAHTSTTSRREEFIQRAWIQHQFAQIASRRRHKDEEMGFLIVDLATMGGPSRKLRTYLTRGDLPGDPLAESAWAYLWGAQNNQAFITTMGVDVNTFNTILHPFAELWNAEPIPWGDVNPHGKPQLARRLLDAAGCLGLVLHWLCSTMPGYLLQQLFAITPAVCS
jgi:hypothetical protein